MLILLASLLSLVVGAPPVGIYCSCGPTNSRSSSISQTIVNQPFVDGTLVRIAWSDIEISNNVFNWTLLDNQISLAESYDSQIALAIVNGPLCPTWLYPSAESITLVNFYCNYFRYLWQGRNNTLPVPWDSFYLSEWTSLVAQLGAVCQLLFSKSSEISQQLQNRSCSHNPFLPKWF